MLGEYASLGGLDAYRFSSALSKGVLLLVAGSIDLESIALHNTGQQIITNPAAVSCTAVTRIKDRTHRHAREECRKLSHTFHFVLSLRELLCVDLQRSLLRPWHAGCIGQVPQPGGQPSCNSL